MTQDRLYFEQRERLERAAAVAGVHQPDQSNLDKHNSVLHA
jgi:hypothetical protein